MPDEQTLTRWRVPLDRGTEEDLIPRPPLQPASPPRERGMGEGVASTPSSPGVRDRVAVTRSHTRSDDRAPERVGHPRTGGLGGGGGGGGPQVRSGKFVVHPRYAAWLARCGVTSADTALSLVGEVVSGHTDRHVVRVDLRSGAGCRTGYLKREHVAGVRWRAKNWAAGFGWVSRCEREGTTLAALEAAGLPGPQWLAHGEDANGRAFLLVDDLAGAVDLLTLLRDQPAGDKRELATRIGTALAELHAAGFGTPDLAAKHLMIADGGVVTVIDWPSAPKPGHIRNADLVRWFGSLHAGLAAELVTKHDRLRVLWAYRRTCRRLGRPVPDRFGFMARAVNAAAARREDRQSVRAQRHATDRPQRLVWVAGEAVVAVPEVAAVWPTPAEAAPFYPPTPTATPPHGHRERVILPNDRPAVLVRFHTVDPVGRVVAAVRERPWRSPAATAARVLFHLERHSIPAPQLLAFGQRMTSAVAAESFLCADLPSGVVSLAAFLARASTTSAQSAAVLSECGRLLRRLHDAGLRPTETGSPNDPLFVVSDDYAVSVAVGSPFAVRVLRRVNGTQRKTDLTRFLQPFDRTAGGWVKGGYHGASG